jgi:hypothetical protein
VFVAILQPCGGCDEHLVQVTKVMHVINFLSLSPYGNVTTMLQGIARPEEELFLIAMKEVA